MRPAAGKLTKVDCYSYSILLLLLTHTGRVACQLPVFSFHSIFILQSTDTTFIICMHSCHRPRLRAPTPPTPNCFPLPRGWLQNIRMSFLPCIASFTSSCNLTPHLYHPMPRASQGALYTRKIGKWIIVVPIAGCCCCRCLYCWVAFCCVAALFSITYATYCCQALLPHLQGWLCADIKWNTTALVWLKRIGYCCILLNEIDSTNAKFVIKADTGEHL